MSDELYLSVVVPFYNEEDNITEMYKRVKTVVEKIGKKYEIIFVSN